MTGRTVFGVAALAAVVTLAVALTGRAQTPTIETPTTAASIHKELKVLKFIPLGGEGRWDYITVDADARRIYVARETRIMVVDADSEKLIGEVPDINGAHGVAIVPGFNLGFATAGKSNEVVVFDTLGAGTLNHELPKPTQKIKAGKNPDAILYDAASKKVYAFNHGDGTVTIIDPYALEKAPVTLEVGGTLEFGVTDNAGHVYVNVEDKNEVVAIDTKEQKVTAHWKLAPGEEPTGLAIDPVRKVLFVGCHNQKMVMLDSENGKVLDTVEIGKGVDGVAFDAKLGLAMSANGGGRDKDGEGTITSVMHAYQSRPSLHPYMVIQTLKTVKGARTIADDPKTNRVYLPCMMGNVDPAVGDSKIQASTFGLLVVGTSDSATTQPK